MSLAQQLADAGFDTQRKKGVPTPRPKVMPKCDLCDEQSVWRFITNRGRKHEYYCQEHSPWNKVSKKAK